MNLNNLNEFQEYSFGQEKIEFTETGLSIEQEAFLK